MRYSRLLQLVVAFIAMAVSGLLFAQQANTLRLGETASSPPASIEDVSWISGNWRGPAFGGVAEEMWGPPQGNSMMGSYRLVQEGKVAFYEIQTIVEMNNSLVFRLKHFNPDLSGWETQDAAAAVSFPLVKIENNAVYFDGLTFRKLASGELQVHLRLQRGEAESEVGFLYQAF